jgi:hypothetical protein
MLHLLTDSQKKKVIKEYRLRLTTVICWLIIFVSLVGAALLLPSYLTAVGKVNVIKAENQSKENSVKDLKAQNFNDKIKQIDSNLNALKVSVSIPSPRETYDKIIGSLPRGVFLSRYTYLLVSDSSASISIDGTAIDRDTLAELQNRLKLNKEFSGINIPITWFTKKKDLSFSLKFDLIKIVKK